MSMPDTACPTSGCGSPVPWLRLAVGLLVAAQSMTLGLTVSLTDPAEDVTALRVGMLIAAVVVTALLGPPLAVAAGRELRRGRLTIELLFLAGIAAAMGISVRSLVAGEGPAYFEVVSILLVVYALGKAVGEHSRSRALTAGRELMSAIAVARVGDRTVPVAEVRIGDRVRVLAGEAIPVDGRIAEGTAFVRATAFTGETASSVRRAGDAVSAGTVCEDGVLVVEATAPGDGRRVDALLAAIDEAVAEPAGLQRQADRWVRVFLSAVAAVAVGTLLWWWRTDGFETGLLNALAVLLVACPCAAGLATPLTVWTVIGRLAARGLLLRSGEVVERLASAGSVVFDKTGTLADQTPSLRELRFLGHGLPDAAVAAIIAAAERSSPHPVARLLAGIPVPADAPAVAVQSFRTVPGRGVEADVRIAQAHHHISIFRDDDRSADGGLTVRVDIDGIPAAIAVVGERLRGSARPAVERLAELGLPVQVMTGDGEAGARDAAALAPTRSALTPEGKLDLVRAMRDARPVFVGDGFNDAAAMAAAHVGIAVAEGGDTVTVRTASATLHGGDLTLVPEAVALCRKAAVRVRENLALAAGYNALGVALAAGGWLHPVAAAVLMTLSSALVAWRSLRVAEADDGPLPAPAPATAVRRRTVSAVHAVGVLGQAALLIPLAGLVGGAALGAMLAAAAAAWLVVRFRDWLPDWADMTVAMATLGGLGMNLGWWADVGFGSAVAAGGGCCGQAESAGWAGMYLGMLGLGVPAMYLLRDRPVPFSWRNWCCVGPLVLGVPGMILGMKLGGAAAAGWAGSPEAQVVADWAGMVLGMCAGMLPPHLGEIFGGEAVTPPARTTAPEPRPAAPR
jgi:heavy metal translocating P-type ATPase